MPDQAIAAAGDRRMRWKGSIDECDRGFVDACAGSDVLKCSALLRAVERSRLRDIETMYLECSDGGGTRAVVPCYTFELPLELLTAGWLKRWIASIRRWFPGFLKPRILFVGTPIAICDHMLHLEGRMVGDGLLEEILDEIRRHSVRLGSSMVIVKEIPAHDADLLVRLEASGFVIGRSLPNSILILDGRVGGWMEGLRKKYRQRIRYQMDPARDPSGFSWEFVDDLECHAERFEQLYLQVLERSAFQYETLNRDFFAEMGRNLGGECRAMVCRDRDGEIVCFELILERGDVCVPLYLGIDYGRNVDGHLYFSCINRIIEYAQARGMREVKFGQTSYQAKAYVGALFEELSIGAHSSSRILQSMLKVLGPHLFTAPPLPEVNVYRSEVATILRRIAGERGHVVAPSQGCQGGTK